MAQRYKNKNKTLSSVRDTSVYHFVIWPEPVIDVKDLCTDMKTVEVSQFILHNSNVFLIFKDTREVVHLFEVYTVNANHVCRSLNTFDFIEITNKVQRRCDFHNLVITSTAAIV